MMAQEQEPLPDLAKLLAARDKLIPLLDSTSVANAMADMLDVVNTALEAYGSRVTSDAETIAGLRRQIDSLKDLARGYQRDCEAEKARADKACGERDAIAARAEAAGEGMAAAIGDLGRISGELEWCAAALERSAAVSAVSKRLSDVARALAEGTAS